MSHSASAYEERGSSGAELTPEGVAHWRAEVQAFFVDALAQLGECIDSLESQVHAASGPPPVRDEPNAAPQREDTANGRSRSSISPTADELHDRRLAELAQRLEAKLNDSGALRPGLKESP